MRRREKSREELLIKSVAQTYFDFIKFIESPHKAGYVAILLKLKPQSKELIRTKLLDILIKTERDLRILRNRMRGIMGYYKDDQPDGIKE